MSEIEERARNMGWVPLDEFRGDPDNWRDAEEFVERGENIMPILKERLTRMEKTLAEKDARLDKITNNLESFAKFHKGTYKRAYEKALKEVEQRKLRAVEEGDIEAYQQATIAEKEVIDEYSQALPEGSEMEPVPEFFDFQAANPWYNKDLAMTAYINAIGPMVAKNVSNNVEFYAELERAARAEFPHKFQAKQSGVESGGDGGGSGDNSGKKGWKDLPKEAKQAYMDNFSNIEGFSKEDYAKDYFVQEEV